MLQLDVLSSFALCGAGALVGAAMLRPRLADDAASADALRICRGGFALVGAGLLQPIALPAPLPLWSQALMAFASIGGLITTGWALAAIAGGCPPRHVMWFTLAVVGAAVLAALPFGTPGVCVACALGLAAGASLIAVFGRRLVARPRDAHERLIGATIVLVLLSSLLRASYLVTWQGPWETYLLHVPPAMVTPYCLLYGVLPVTFAMLLHNVINARLLGRLHLRAMTDHLTGSLSRHALADGAQALAASTRAGAGRLAVVMVDFDHFKQINDQHGHAAGDAVLRHAVTVLQAQLRPDALLARYGGEEFVVLAPVESLPAARRVAERLREAIEQQPWTDVVPGLPRVTASLGVTVLGPDEGLEPALARADEALYRAKAGGRNQVQAGLVAA